MKYIKPFNEGLSPDEKQDLDNDIYEEIAKFPEGQTLTDLIEIFGSYDDIMDSLERLFELGKIRYFNAHYSVWEKPIRDVPIKFS